MNDSEWFHINQPHTIDETTLRLLVENFVRICEFRGESIWGKAPAQWASIFIDRIGQEPMFRLVFVFVGAVESSGSCLSEVMAQDPVLFAQCMAIGDLRPYYEQYQGAPRPPA
jgi:hypothetical protein